MPPDPALRAAEALRRARALVVTAGARMGVDSGLPGFRGDQALEGLTRIDRALRAGAA